MPAQIAIQHEPRVGAFYHKLLDRGKSPMVAVVAVMRKLLHAIYGMLKIALTSTARSSTGRPPTVNFGPAP